MIWLIKDDNVWRPSTEEEVAEVTHFDMDHCTTCAFTIDDAKEIVGEDLPEEELADTIINHVIPIEELISTSGIADPHIPEICETGEGNSLGQFVMIDYMCKYIVGWTGQKLSQFDIEEFWKEGYDYTGFDKYSHALEYLKHRTCE